ncbi:MAG: hypothetical protein PHN51_05110 [Candidatus Nanopelagicales bacterium]|nr:hypothetical protein [Candidatus Nanopelagicales bacterium]
MSPDDHLTGTLALILGLAMSVTPAVFLGIYWGPKLWRNRGGQNERSAEKLAAENEISG